MLLFIGMPPIILDFYRDNKGGIWLFGFALFAVFFGIGAVFMFIS